VGFSAAWLAFSGLESISQLSRHAPATAQNHAMVDVAVIGTMMCDRRY